VIQKIPIRGKDKIPIGEHRTKKITIGINKTTPVIQKIPIRGKDKIPIRGKDKIPIRGKE
jgi:hypothetical protein